MESSKKVKPKHVAWDKLAREGICTICRSRGNDTGFKDVFDLNEHLQKAHGLDGDIEELNPGWMMRQVVFDDPPRR
jgi:hypothetical protein